VSPRGDVDSSASNSDAIAAPAISNRRDEQADFVDQSSGKQTAIDRAAALELSVFTWKCVPILSSARATSTLSLPASTYETPAERSEARYASDTRSERIATT
jgi:hypothetical protein